MTVRVARSMIPTSARAAVLSALIMLGSGCAAVPPSTLVRGDPTDIASLVGDWEGTYEGHDIDRRGTISFRLRAGTDTAQGEVVMTPRILAGHMGPDGVSVTHREGAAAPALTIRFVQAGGEEVLGVLDSYWDAGCGCLITTRFRGRITADSIEGTYESRAGHDAPWKLTGRWRVARRIGSA